MSICYTCGKDLGPRPVDDVDKGKRDEVIILHRYDEEESTEQFKWSEKKYFCSTECLQEYLEDEEGGKDE